jgi:CheY-like chemotaxis protein
MTDVKWLVRLLKWPHVDGILGMLLAMSTVLVVDDDKVNCTLINYVIKRAGFETVVANDGNTALMLLPQADLAIVDVFLPQNKGMAGLDILRYIKGDPSLKSLPVIVMTAAPNYSLEYEARQAGCEAFMTKPFDPQSLLRLVVNLMEKHLS